MVQGMKQLKIDDTFEYTDNMSEADALIALQSKFKKNSRLQAAARSRGIPTYICKTSSLAQLTKTIQSFMSDFAGGLEIFESEAKTNESEKMDALEEARIAIEQVVIPKGEPVDLLPRPSNILLLQKDLIRKYKLPSESVESETGVRMRILPLQSKIDDDIPGSEDDDDDANNIGQLHGIHDETNGSIFFIDRLPFLPD